MLAASEEEGWRSDEPGPAPQLLAAWSRSRQVKVFTGPNIRACCLLTNT